VRAIGFICAAHRSYSSCTQYRQNVLDARTENAQDGQRDVSVTYVGDWHTHPKFVSANAGRVRAARARLEPTLRGEARLVFTAHSIPESMTGAARYKAQLLETCALVSAELGMSDWALVFQSRSGRPEDPWLGPDISDYLRESRASGLQAAVLCPIGFLCDHIEVLYDLDHEAAAVCAEIGLPMVRAESVNDDPLFLDMMCDVVIDTWQRYERGRPLVIAPRTAPERVEGPPVARGPR
jgi:ferrochelatase